MTIGEKIKKYRDKAGVSREQLADALHETVLTLDLLESGRVSPTDEEIQRICEVLSVSKKEFLRDDDTTESATTEVTAERNSGENYVFKFDEMQIYGLRKSIMDRLILFWGALWAVTLVFPFVVLTFAHSSAWAVVLFVVFGVCLFLGIFILASTRRALKENFTLASETTYVYQVFDDSFVVKMVRNHENVSMQKVYFRDVKQVKVRGTFLCLYSNGKIYLLNKNEMADNSALFALSKKKIVKDKYSSHAPKGLQTAGWVFFALAILSIFVALGTIGVIAAKSDGEALGSVWWIMLCFLAIPVTSIVLGICLKARGAKYQGNIIAGSVVSVIMIIVILISVLFSSLSTLFADVIDKVEREVGIDIPQYNSISINSYMDTGSGNIRSVRTTVMTFTDENAEELERSIVNSGKWIHYNATSLDGLVGLYGNDKDYDYCIIYNSTTSQYNSLPHKAGDYWYINVLYDMESNTMKIVEYALVYGNR